MPWKTMVALIYTPSKVRPSKIDYEIWGPARVIKIYTALSMIFSVLAKYICMWSSLFSCKFEYCC